MPRSIRATFFLREGKAMDLNLTDKVVLVTGGGRGLGEACVRGFVAEGAQVIAVARTEETLDRLEQELPGIETWAMDITTDAFIDRVANLDRLDVLVNNAGFNAPRVMPEIDRGVLDHMLDLNVRAVFLASQAALGVMARQGTGAIVNMSSQMGPRRTAYCLTKHAVEGLTRAMAVEVAAQGIRVNSVAPTFIETDLTRPMLDDPAFKDYVIGMIPQRELGRLEDVVNAVLFLSSDVSSTTTGHSLLVDGGWTAH